MHAFVHPTSLSLRGSQDRAGHPPVRPSLNPGSGDFAIATARPRQPFTSLPSTHESQRCSSRPEPTQPTHSRGHAARVLARARDTGDYPT